MIKIILFNLIIIYNKKKSEGKNMEMSNKTYAIIVLVVISLKKNWFLIQEILLKEKN